MLEVSFRYPYYSCASTLSARRRINIDNAGSVNGQCIHRNCLALMLVWHIFYQAIVNAFTCLALVQFFHLWLQALAISQIKFVLAHTFETIV
jgi:hypothetical protein